MVLVIFIFYEHGLVNETNIFAYILYFKILQTQRKNTQGVFKEEISYLTDGQFIQ